MLTNIFGPKGVNLTSAYVSQSANWAVVSLHCTMGFELITFWNSLLKLLGDQSHFGHDGSKKEKDIICTKYSNKKLPGISESIRTP